MQRPPGDSSDGISVNASLQGNRPRTIVLRNRSGRRRLIRAGCRIGREIPVRWADRIETVVRTVNVLLSHVRALRN